jgi:type IV pilus assembly protein PilM
VFRRNYLGLEIYHLGLRAVAIQRRGSGFALTGGQTLKFSEGVLQPSVLEPNIRKPEAFVDGVREVLLPLARREKRVAVALPDTSGHTYLLDVDTPFKSHSEGLEIVRWQIKEMLPPQMKAYAADFQVIEERESGGRRVLVSVLARDVLTQYEELLSQAGFAAGLIDFHALNLYNAYHSRIELGSDFFLIGVDENQLCMLAFENQMLDLCRTKTVPEDPERIFQEINRSMVGYRRSHGSMTRMKVHLHTNWPEPAELHEAVKSAFEREVELLPSPFHALNGVQRLNITNADACGMAAALGVAERMIPRVA